MLLRLFALTFFALLLQSCPTVKYTYDDLMRDGDQETRALLREACEEDRGSRRCKAAINPNWINRTLYSPDTSRSEICEACRNHGVQGYTSTSNKDFKPGCEVLEEGLKPEEKDKLMQCFNSLRASITHGISRSELENPQKPASGQEGLREKLFCNMYKYLRPEEQHFMGMMLTTVGEGRSIMDSRYTDNPKYQEGLFIQKTIDNRLRSAREGTGNNDLNALDIALAKSQFSMYNNGEFYKKDPQFYKLFDPLDRSNDKAFDRAINAFSALENEEDKIEPEPASDNVAFYYNPHGMVKISSLPASKRAEARRRVNFLKATGKIPSWHPSDRAAPQWDFSQITMTEDLSYDGKTPNTDGKQTHVFYRDNDGKPDYGGKNKVPPKWRAQCGGAAE